MAKKADVYVSVPLTHIMTDKIANVRKRVDVTDLAESVKRMGILVPLQVKARSRSDKFDLLDGFRRLAAAKKAGRTSVPCIVTSSKISSADCLLLALATNVPQKSWSPIEEAAACQMALDEGALKIDVAKSVGASVTHIDRRLRLLRLSDLLCEALQSERIGVSAAELVARLPVELHEKMLRIAANSTVADLKKAVIKEEEKLKRPPTQRQEPESGAGAGESDTKAEQAALRKMRTNLRKTMMRVAQAFAMDQVDAAAVFDYGELPDDAVKLLLPLLLKVPCTKQELVAATARLEERKAAAKPAKKAKKDKFPQEPVFVGGAKGKAAKFFTKVFSGVHKEHRSELIVRLMEISVGRSGSLKVDVAITSADIKTFAAEAGIAESTL